MGLGPCGLDTKIKAEVRDGLNSFKKAGVKDMGWVWKTKPKKANMKHPKLHGFLKFRIQI